MALPLPSPLYYGGTMGQAVVSGLVGGLEDVIARRDSEAKMRKAEKLERLKLLFSMPGGAELAIAAAENDPEMRELIMGMGGGNALTRMPQKREAPMVNALASSGAPRPMPLEQDFTVGAGAPYGGENVFAGAAPTLGDVLGGESEELNQLASDPYAATYQQEQENKLYLSPFDKARAALKRREAREALKDEARAASTELARNRSAYYGTRMMPPSEKAAVFAQASQMGYDPTETLERLKRGQTIRDMAIDAGYDPNNLPDLNYPATQTSVSQMQRRNMAVAEINSLEKRISEGMAPYVRKVAGFSPQQIMDAIKGQKEDTQARFIASRILQPELAGARMRVMAGIAGVEIIKHMVDSSLGRIKIFEAFVKPSTYIKANEYVNEYLNEAMDAANKLMTQPRGQISRRQRQEEEDLTMEEEDDEIMTQLKGAFEPTQAQPGAKRRRYNRLTRTFE